MRYEHKAQKLATTQVYYRRIAYNITIASIIMLLCLAIGVLGYRYTAHVAWIDALHNAAMILSGMGPVINITTTSGKLFSSAYALFSGIAFITNIGFILAPAVHRFFHSLHLDITEN